MNKPKLLTESELLAGKLASWGILYAGWLSQQPSFQNQNNRAAWGRVRAIRALRRKLEAMLPTFTHLQINAQVDAVVELAKLQARSEVQ